MELRTAVRCMRKFRRRSITSLTQFMTGYKRKRPPSEAALFWLQRWIAVFRGRCLVADIKLLVAHGLLGQSKISGGQAIKLGLHLWISFVPRLGAKLSSFCPVEIPRGHSRPSLHIYPHLGAGTQQLQNGSAIREILQKYTPPIGLLADIERHLRRSITCARSQLPLTADSQNHSRRQTSCGPGGGDCPV